MNINLINIYHNISTLGPIGYFIASGTFGSLFGLFISILLKICINNSIFSYVPNNELYLILFLLILSFFIIGKGLNKYKGYNHDPSEIILDEVIGMIIVFYNIPITLDKGIGYIIIGFILFRFFDITKIFGISYLDKNIKGALGIIIDDVMAAIFARTCLEIIISVNLI